jgi:tape measure domain-containing protein
MATDDVSIRVRLLDAARARADALRVAGVIKQIGTDATRTAGAAARMGAAVDSAGRLAGRGLSALSSSARYGAAGIAGLAVASTKWGLSFNAQVESARLRFKLFTDDVAGLTGAVQNIDMNSAFNFGDLSDAAALLGNSGVKNIPGVLQATANAAAASGKGLPALQGISVALSQIAAKGKLSQEEINQLNEAGAPGAQKIIQKAFNLTKEELGNLGAEGLSSKKAIDALTEAWTSGRMAKAAKDQTKTLGGQWALLTGNLQKASGAATLGLAGGLEHDVLPAANRASQAITDIFGKKGLSDTQKLRQAKAVIEQELGPIWEDIKQDIDEADIPGKLGEVIGDAAPQVIGAAGHLGFKGVEAFVEAWMASGAWAKVLSTLFLAKKLGLVGKLAGAGAGRLPGIGGLLNKPVPVFVTNPGFGGPGGPGGPGGKPGGSSWVKKAGQGSSILAGGAAAIAGQQQIVEHVPDAMHIGPFTIGPLGGGLTSKKASDLYQGPSLLNEIATTVQLKIGDHQVGQAVARDTKKSRARQSGGKG